MYLGTKRLEDAVKKYNLVEGLVPGSIGPASIDLHLGNTIMHYPHMVYNDIPEAGMFLYRGECVLVATSEIVNIPSHLVARVEGKSSIGRQFLQVHVTAGWIDPGFRFANITLELVNHSIAPFLLVPGMAICQLAVMEVDGASPYTGKYMGDRGPKAAK